LSANISEVNSVVQNKVDQFRGVIKTARLAKKMTQTQLAAAVGITPRHLMSLENSNRKPSYDLLFQLIRTLDISADTIFYPEYEHKDAEARKLQRHGE
jgi:transcriptional regulator with XRE-family HTH domain